ncbi:hypothetical protein [Roseivirga pacifica]|uniref:hypothetical protein n=1 Tax=Roseivirga pacifica TaxID=1267423 RepID=UPI00227C759B|nr:hypothetical protein [Roseivirga pacifica]
MQNKQDYTLLSLEQLKKAEKKIYRQAITAAVIIGFLFGIIIFGLLKNGFGFLYVFIPAILIVMVYKQSKTLHSKLADIREEMNYKQATNKSNQ